MQTTTLLWLLWQRLEGISARTVSRLQACSPDPAILLELPLAALRQAGVGDAGLASLAAWRRQGEAHPAWQRALRDADWLQRHQAQLLTPDDPRWPALLREITDPPPLLLVRGDPALLERLQLAIVGSRRASRHSLFSAGQFATELVQAGFVVTSGLAHGIDAAAHRAALAAAGGTVAVLGTGLDRPYPARNRGLYDEIACAGTLISEFPLGAEPLRAHFPRRNRIISGLSVGVLVVEAALRSGSLVTARLAMEQNREVFAVPGPIHGGGHRGCHALIRDGALLVEETADVLQALGHWWRPEPLARQADLALTGRQLAVLSGLDFAATDLDSLLQATGLEIAELLGILTDLELVGLVESTPAGYQRTGAELAIAAGLG